MAKRQPKQSKTDEIKKLIKEGKENGFITQDDILLIFPPFLISQPPLPAAHFRQQNTPPKSPTHVAYNRLLQ